MSPEASDLLEELADRTRITNLLLTFEEGIRTSDIEAITSVFAEGATLEYPGHHLVGHEEIRSYFESTLDTRSPNRRSVLAFDATGFSTPFLGPVLISFEREFTRCTSTTLAIHAGMSTGEAVIIMRAVRDEDELIKDGSTWRIRSRRHSRLWGLEVPGTLYQSTDA